VSALYFWKKTGLAFRLWYKVTVQKLVSLFVRLNCIIQQNSHFSDFLYSLEDGNLQEFPYLCNENDKMGLLCNQIMPEPYRLIRPGRPAKTIRSGTNTFFTTTINRFS
jgi:hypothetical protein